MKKFISVCEELKSIANKQIIVLFTAGSEKRFYSCCFAEFKPSRFVIIDAAVVTAIFLKRFFVENENFNCS